MRRPILARALVALGAVAVTLALLSLDRDHDRCAEAAQAAFLAARAPAPELRPRIDALLDACPGSGRPLEIAVGLREERPRAAARIARAVAEREPESYTAWAVLAIAAPPAEAAAALRRARALNPLSVPGAGP